MAKSTLPKPQNKINDELIGKRFNRLTVIREDVPHLTKEGYNRKHYVCLCDCGNQSSVYISQLKNGKTKSCGCLQKEHATRLKTTHGFSSHPLNNIYMGMKSRCYTESHIEFKHYGGRGIKMCPAWLNSREVFYEWALANGWQKGLWMDRRDTNKDYTPGNCRFVTPGLSARNTRTIQATNTSGYRGVSWNKKDKAWSGNIQCDNDKYYLGEFDSALEAAQAYDAKAKELDAEHPLNFPNGGI